MPDCAESEQTDLFVAAELQVDAQSAFCYDVHSETGTEVELTDASAYSVQLQNLDCYNSKGTKEHLYY